MRDASCCRRRACPSATKRFITLGILTATHRHSCRGTLPLLTLVVVKRLSRVFEDRY